MGFIENTGPCIDGVSGALHALLRRLSTDGGRIVSTSTLTPAEIMVARAGGRMLVTRDGYGFAHVPDEHPGEAQDKRDERPASTQFGNDVLDAEGPIPLRIRLTRPNAKAPTYATDGASGMDGYMASWGGDSDMVTLYPGQRALAHLGIAAEIPPGYELQVRPRSGLALKRGVVAMLGTIDSDYRGEISATLVNLGDEPYTLAIGDRVCQLVLAPVARARVEVVETLGETGRGEGGFGHTGK